MPSISDRSFVPIIFILIVTLTLIFFTKYRARARERLERERLEREKLEREKLLESLKESQEDIKEAVFQFVKILYSELYISKSSYPAWKKDWIHLKPLATRWKESGLTEDEIQTELSQLHDAFENGEDLVHEHNENYINRELEKFKHFFDSVEDRSIDRSSTESKKCLNFSSSLLM